MEKQYSSFFNKIFVVLLVFSIVFPSLVRAQEADVLYAPTSAWLVGLSRLTGGEEQSVPYPCVMAAQYSNGYIFRFSGDESRVMTMAVDFRQAVFATGQSYALGLSFTPGDGSGPAVIDREFPATAYDPATLIVPFLAQDGDDTVARQFHDYMEASGVLSLRVGGQALPFALIGVQNGVARLARCYREQGRLAPSAGQ